MKRRSLLLCSVLVALALASCDDNEFPTEPIRSKRRSSVEVPVIQPAGPSLLLG